MIEDNLPLGFHMVAYHPSKFVYAWKKKDLEKLFDEFNMSNIAIKSIEAWLIIDDKITSLIPLKHGDIQIFEHKTKQADDEEWNDYVNRGNKEVLETVNGWHLDRMVALEHINDIWYHLNITQK